MSIGEMSVSGAVMIGVIVIIRALTLHRLPKKTFLALWGVALVRLLVPYSLPAACSVYSLAGRLTPMAEDGAAVPAVQTVPAAPTAGVAATPFPSASGALAPSVTPWTVVWLTGAAACAVFFAVTYGKCRREFRESLPVENGFVKSWLASHRLRRAIDIRQSGKISAPLTYGVFRPVILMPKNTNWNDLDSLKYVLAHEYVHIRRFDAAAKLALTLAFCVHWFNPMVWVMYVLANRDMELSCDEAVVRQFGEDAKSAYALTLIRMEETKSGLAAVGSGFSKNAVEERIVAIMKMKKITVAALLAAVVMVAGVMAVFATTGETAAQDDPAALSDEELDNNSEADTEWWTAEEYEAWLEQEKADLQSIIGERGWTPSTGWFTWTQEMVDETIALYEQTLQEIKDGKMVSKPTQDGDTMIQFSYDPNEMETATETGEVYITADSDEQEFSPERLAEYEAFGLTYDKSAKTLYYNGKPVRCFIDSVDIGGNISTAYQYWNGEGTVDIHTVRQAVQNADGSTDPFGKLTGVEEI